MHDCNCCKLLLFNIGDILLLDINGSVACCIPLRGEWGRTVNEFTEDILLPEGIPIIGKDKIDLSYCKWVCTNLIGEDPI